MSSPVLAAPLASSPRAHRIAPGPRGHWLWGSLREFREDPVRLITEATRDFGDVVRFRLGPFVAHVIAHPDGVKHVLQDNNKNYGRQTPPFDSLRETLGNGLLTSEGEFWRRQRRIAQPAFHRQRIASFAALIVEATERTMQRWASRAETGEAFDLTPELLAMTLRMLGLIMFGRDLSDDADSIGPSVKEVLEQAPARMGALFPIPRFVPTPANRRFKEAVTTLDRLVLAMIGERRGRTDDPGDLLSMLLKARDDESGEGMSDRQLRDELLTILGAGHETTSMALVWMFMLLSRHPIERRRLETELDSVLGERAPTLADLPNLPYTRAVVDESMRLFPPAWGISRSVTEDDEIGGYHIPAGSLVFVSPWITHRHPAFWSNPEGFDPDRFAPGTEAGRSRYTYFPFGGGPHMCIGDSLALLECVLVVATVSRTYRLDLLPGHRIETKSFITVHPRYGLMVTAHRR